MNYTKEEVLQFVEEEDVRFIRLAFCDIHGVQKNIAIMPSMLARAFEYGVHVDLDGKELYLKPDPSTLCGLPWRSIEGKVIRMFCDIFYADGTPYEGDSRRVLKQAMEAAKEKNILLDIGTSMKFYVFKADDEGRNTGIPYDEAGYLDVAPLDKGENIRREIVITLEEMGLHPESSRHEEGPGQNEVAFRYADPLTTADNDLTFKFVVQSIAYRSGLYADFSPKPMANQPGNGLGLCFSASDASDEALLNKISAGIAAHLEDISLFLNPTAASYTRLHDLKRVFASPTCVDGRYRRTLLSADASYNPYLAFALLIYAALDGVEKNLDYKGCGAVRIPSSLATAVKAAKASGFAEKYLPKEIVDAYYLKG